MEDKKASKTRSRNIATPPFDLNKFTDSYNYVRGLKNETDCVPIVKSHIESFIKNSGLDNKYLILFLYGSKINEFAADQIYECLSGSNEEKDILLIIHSNGGSIEPAYLISRNCKDSAKKFCVAIPRKAKSAATLLALGADEIHMGAMSQLGPIDPQIDGWPALGLQNALDYLASLTKKYPDSGPMLSAYLSSKLDLMVLGYLQRLPDSAVQYAEILLRDKELPTGSDPINVARKLVYEYKDHGFVIDKYEAKGLLGNTIRVSTPEYILSDKIHRFLDNLNLLFDVLKGKELNIVGSLGKNGINFRDIKKK